jgi:hypothetical protein
VSDDELVLTASNGDHHHAEKISLQDGLIGQAILLKKISSDVVGSQDWSRALIVPLLLEMMSRALGHLAYSVRFCTGRIARSE